MPKEMQLLVNFPFCRKKQPIYGGMVLECTDKALLGRYFEALKREAEAVKEDTAGYCITGIRFMGGPLNLAPCSTWQLFINNIKKLYPVEHPHVNLRFSPDTLSRDDIYHFMSIPGGYASVDMISFVTEELAAAGFAHQPQDNIQADLLFFELRFRRYEAILCCGLPGQTPESLLVSLRGARRLYINHISILPYRDMGEAELANYRKLAGAYLRAEGYVEYAPLHFGVEGIRMALYEKQPEDYMGLGLGAISRIDGLCFCNTGDLGLYLTRSDDFEAICTRLA